MLFNSFSFLVFFPVVTAIYFLLPHRYRWMWLLLSSCVFYMFFKPVYILILFVTICIDYWAGLKIAASAGRKRKVYLWLSIISTILVLAVFKYADFVIGNTGALVHLFNPNFTSPLLNIVLPIGLSFHTFQSLSYVIEVYRGNQKPERHFGIYSLYVMFYPQLVAGPIERPQQMLHQFYEKHQFKYDDVTSGLKLMAWGFFKKLVIADRLSAIISPVYNNPAHYSGLTLLICTILFAQQIYCDFSGYSDIAFGTARVMGFRLMKNFDMPYFSSSVSEFWSRWHISLSRWFRDYVYIPLGGNRVVRWRWYYNIMLTFLLSGLWHGANWTYIIWGGLNGIYLIIEAQSRGWFSKVIKYLKLNDAIGLLNLLRVLITFLLICAGWVFFRANSVADALLIFTKIFKGDGFATANLQLEPVALTVSVVLILLLETLQGIHKQINLPQWLATKPAYVRIVAYTILTVMILNMGIFVSKGFIYFQF